MADTIVTLSGDDAKLLAAFLRVKAEQEKQDKGWDKNRESSKKSTDSQVEDLKRREREEKRAADAIYREHQKLLDAKDLESRKAAQKQRTLASDTQNAEVKAMLKKAEEELKIIEKQQAARVKASEKALALAEKTADKEAEASEKRLKGLAAGVASYVSLNAIADAYKQNLQDQIALQDQSLAKVNEIAAAQSGAIKNLSGLSIKQKAETLNTAKQLQAELGFAEQTPLINAIGAGYSASGDLEKTLSAVRSAAQLTRLTPSELPTVAAGALDAARGTGVADARQNLSFLLQAGAISRVDDPSLLAKTIAPTISSGVATVPKQNRQDAAKEIAAIYSELNQFATDTKGDSTRTATVTLLSKLEEFFNAAGEDADKLRAKIAPLERKASAPAGRGKKAGLYPEEQKELDDLKKELAALAPLQDPGTILGRRELIKSDPELKKKFFETSFGEAAFKSGFRQFFEDGTLFENVKKNKGVLNFDATEFNQQVAQAETLTPEMRVATENARAASIIEQRKNNPNAATIASMRELANDALVRNRRGLIGGALDVGYGAFESALEPGGNDVQASSQFFAARLMRQQNRIMDAGGSSPEDKAKIADLEATIQEILARNARQGLSPTTDSRAKELENSDRQTKALETLVDRVGVPNPAGAIRNQLTSPNAN